MRMLDPFEQLTQIVGRALQGPLKGEFSIPMLPQSKLHSALHPGSPYTDPLAAAILMTELVRKLREIYGLLTDLIYCMEGMPYHWRDAAGFAGSKKDLPQESEDQPIPEES